MENLARRMNKPEPHYNCARVVVKRKQFEKIPLTVATTLYRNISAGTSRKHEFMEAEKTTGILRRLLRLSDKYTAIPVNSLLDFQA